MRVRPSLVAAIAAWLAIGCAPEAAVDARPTSAPVAAVVSASPSCVALDESGLGSANMFPTATAADVLRGAVADPAVRHYLNEIAGVPAGPMRHARAPACRPDLLQLGAPIFVRAYPAISGAWLVPVEYSGDELAVLLIGRDVGGMGALSGSRGSVHIPSEAAAREAGSVPADGVVSAELVFANASCGRDLITWRLVRASGAVVYLIPDFPGAPPPGALLTDTEVWFTPTGSRPAFGLAALAAAC